jgi:hypothetical protein
MTENEVTSVRLSGESLDKLFACRATRVTPMLHIINTAVAEQFAGTGPDCMKIFERK